MKAEIFKWFSVFVVVVSFIAAVAIASYRIGALETGNADQESRLRKVEEGFTRIDTQLEDIREKVDFIFERAYEDAE